MGPLETGLDVCFCIEHVFNGCCLCEFRTDVHTTAKPNVKLLPIAERDQRAAEDIPKVGPSVRTIAFKLYQPFQWDQTTDFILSANTNDRVILLFPDWIQYPRILELNLQSEWSGEDYIFNCRHNLHCAQYCKAQGKLQVKASINYVLAKVLENEFLERNESVPWFWQCTHGDV